MSNSYLEHIPPGREGCIYLIHAEGTNRYKIGRSVNPITRRADIQRQSPYPLEIARSSWTLDAIADETRLHERFAEFQIFGEWFELERIEGRGSYSCSYYRVDIAFDMLPTICNLANTAIGSVSDFLNLDIRSHAVLSGCGSIIISVYQRLTSRQEVEIANNFFSNKLYLLISDYYGSVDPELLSQNEFYQKQLDSFISGTICTFSRINLNRGALQ